VENGLLVRFVVWLTLERLLAFVGYHPEYGENPVNGFSALKSQPWDESVQQGKQLAFPPPPAKVAVDHCAVNPGRVEQVLVIAAVPQLPEFLKVSQSAAAYGIRESGTAAGFRPCA
jgi:hypothetical protein